MATNTKTKAQSTASKGKGEQERRESLLVAYGVTNGYDREDIRTTLEAVAGEAAPESDSDIVVWVTPLGAGSSGLRLHYGTIESDTPEFAQTLKDYARTPLIKTLLRDLKKKGGN